MIEQFLTKALLHISHGEENMMKEKAGLNNDNRGSTLIEIIVSVLIIAIVFVPLLMGMSAAMKANDRAEQALNSENAAVNCLETVKMIGISGLDDLAEESESADIFGAGAKISKTVDDEGKATYTVYDLAEGMENYTAKITYSDTRYKATIDPEADPEDQPSLFNDYKYISFSNLTGKGTSVLNFSEEDDEAYLDDIKSMSGANAETTETIPYDYTLGDIIKTKTMIVDIDKEPGASNYKISTRENFEIYNDLGTKPYFESGSTISSGVARTTTCKYGDPDTLIIYYSPIKYDLDTTDPTAPHHNAEASSDRNAKNKLYINNVDRENLRVYVIVTGAGRNNIDGSGTQLDFVDIRCTGATTNVFCSAESDSSGGNFIPIDNIYSITDGDNEVVLLYDVTVEVDNVEKTGTVIEYSALKPAETSDDDEEDEESEG